MFVRRLVNGVRSSWLASAISWFCRCRDAARAAIIRSNERANRVTSSRSPRVRDVDPHRQVLGAGDPLSGLGQRGHRAQSASGDDQPGAERDQAADHAQPEHHPTQLDQHVQVPGQVARDPQLPAGLQRLVEHEQLFTVVAVGMREVGAEQPAQRPGRGGHLMDLRAAERAAGGPVRPDQLHDHLGGRHDRRAGLLARGARQGAAQGLQHAVGGQLGDRHGDPGDLPQLALGLVTEQSRGGHEHHHPGDGQAAERGQRGVQRQPGPQRAGPAVQPRAQRRADPARGRSTGHRAIIAAPTAGRRRRRAFGWTSASGVRSLILMCQHPAVNSHRPQVIAHRGASGTEPEHTLAAYQRAIELGADALECDVRLTADGHLVCVHDRRVDRTSNGRGLVSTLELTQLEGLDWGAWKRIARPDDGERPVTVESGDRSHLLTLRTLLGLVRDCGREVQIAVETKHPTRYGVAVERTLATVLEEFGWARPVDREPARVRMMSFSVLAVRRMRQLAPGVPRVLLMERIPLVSRDGSLRGADIAGISLGLLREQPGYVDRVHRAGGAVHVWTVDEPADVRRCVAAGVDGIITNRPDVVLAELAGVV
jgi:glycerophosphoryl diester phosphodiesterase